MGCVMDSCVQRTNEIPIQEWTWWNWCVNADDEKINKLTSPKCQYKKKPQQFIIIKINHFVSLENLSKNQTTNGLKQISMMWTKTKNSYRNRCVITLLHWVLVKGVLCEYIVCEPPSCVRWLWILKRQHNRFAFRMNVMIEIYNGEWNSIRFGSLRWNEELTTTTNKRKKQNRIIHILSNNKRQEPHNYVHYKNVTVGI